MESVKELCRDRLAPLTCLFLHWMGWSLPTSGEGRGVRSAIAARYGDGRAEAEPGDKDDARLVVDTFDRREDPIVGRLEGEVRLWCSTGSASYMIVGVSMALVEGPVGVGWPRQLVLIVRPALGWGGAIGVEAAAAVSSGGSTAAL